MDSNNVTITITTSSINGQQEREEVQQFADNVRILANKLLSNSFLEITIQEHQHLTRE